jgi:hypothetical protein
MKLFPNNRYVITLSVPKDRALRLLKENTLAKEQYVSNWNNQVFIGSIGANQFEFKLSKKLISHSCVLKGILEENTGIVDLRIGKFYKILFSLVAIFTLSGILTAIVQEKTALIGYLLACILVMRFVFMEMTYRYALHHIFRALNQLKIIDNMEKID